jgi:tetratricopeptide (TPR) repeat protein
MSTAVKKAIKKSPPKSGTRLQNTLFLNVLVFVFAFALFANSIPNNYNLDDELVTINHHLTSKGISAIPEIFRSPYYKDEHGYSYEYRPVVLTSFAIEHQFFGDNPHVSHFFNVFLYALCCVLLYQVLLLLFNTYSPILILAITLIFAAHPAHTEVVCSIKNRDEILALLFSLLAFYAALKSVEKSHMWWILAVLLFSTLALLSKSTIVSFAFIIPLALVLFTDVSVFYLLAVSAALAIPASLLLTLNSEVGRAAVALIILTAPFIFSLLVNPLFVSDSLKPIISKIQKSASNIKSAWLLAPVLVGLAFTALDEIHFRESNFAPAGKPVLVAGIQNRPLTMMEECVTAATPFSIKTGISLEILFHYLHKVILPYPMSFYYGYKFIYPQKIFDFVPLLGLLFYLLLLAAAILLIRREKLMAFGILIYLISVAAFSNNFTPVAGMLAERFLLIPSLGWAVLLLALCLKLLKLSPEQNMSWNTIPSSAKYPFLALVILYAVISFSRNFDWKDDLTLFRHDIAYADMSAQAHNLLGVHLMQHMVTVPDSSERAGLGKEALLHFKRSQQIYPYFFNARYDIGRVYLALNMPDSAIVAFRYALLIDTSFDEIYWNLGTLLMNQRRFDEAKPCFERLIKIIPNDYAGYERLSYLYFQTGQYDKSITENLHAADRFKTMPEPLLNLSRTYMAIHQPDSARLFLKQANALAPANADVQEMMKEIGM